MTSSSHLALARHQAATFTQKVMVCRATPFSFLKLDVSMEFADAIREGDGQRVIRCWRYFMPIFRAAQCTNYACESFNLLYQALQSVNVELVCQRTLSAREKHTT